MEIITSRLSNGIDRAFEFNAINPSSLAAGCARAWAYFNSNLVTDHWDASRINNEFKRYIGQNRSREQEYIERWKAAGKSDTQIAIALKNLQVQWQTQLLKKEQVCKQKKLPHRLQLQVKTVLISKNQKFLNPRNLPRPTYVHSDQSKNDWEDLWAGIVIMRNHDRNLMSFCSWVAKPGTAATPRRPALSIVSNQTKNESPI